MRIFKEEEKRKDGLPVQIRLIFRCQVLINKYSSSPGTLVTLRARFLEIIPASVAIFCFEPQISHNLTSRMFGNYSCSCGYISVSSYLNVKPQISRTHGFWVMTKKLWLYMPLAKTWKQDDWKLIPLHLTSNSKSVALTVF